MQYQDKASCSVPFQPVRPVLDQPDFKGNVRSSQGLTSARSCQQMEQQLSQCGPVETAQVGAEAVVCI